MRRRLVALSDLMSWSSMRIVPDVGSISRLIIFNEVVLPQPEGPTNVTISPAGTVRESESTAATFCPDSA